MNKHILLFAFLVFVYLTTLLSCKKDPPIIDINKPDSIPTYNPTPYELDIPEVLKNKTPNYNTNNPLTNEGVKLGRMLFYDPILSKDNTQSCSSCHQQNFAFTDPRQFSIGVDGIAGTRNSMQIDNVLWKKPFFWDGRAADIEEQALEPVPNPIEMHLSWVEATKKLKRHASYPSLFYQAFGDTIIDSLRIAKAIAQFESILISSNSKWDQFLISNKTPFEFFTPEEYAGYLIFNSETGDCFHCHTEDVMLTDNLFHNNGLNATHNDYGLGAINNNPEDIGKFKTPSLRNVEYTAPYMHDGRFNTLEEVVEFYSFGLQVSPTVDPLMKFAHLGGVQLNEEERAQLVAFLKTFSDDSFISNPNFSSPF
jgi:cytochrome c peroxidase